MKKLILIPTMVVVALSAVLAANAALTDVPPAVRQAADNVGNSVNRTVQQASAFVDDSTVTAKVKSALLEDDILNSNEISVATHQGLVTLSGFVANQSMAVRAVKVASHIEGVQSVSDKLQVTTTGEQSVGAYTEDAMTTGAVKIKLLTDDIVPFHNVRVETRDGVVLLTGRVNNGTQSERAETLAKSVDGVKSVKNALTVRS
ncbi:molecular chaperone OsmY [Musicola keenii]|uniref:molecular chaperone OsmY n=1 Tax=Musicola keenii TaxID=2884250 RepID=UPI00177FBCC5|nr:molecular chaperone OsmY [Musicola keenii]